jgi:hypothetical protein
MVPRLCDCGLLCAPFAAVFVVLGWLSAIGTPNGCNTITGTFLPMATVTLFVAAIFGGLHCRSVDVERTCRAAALGRPPSVL